MSTFYIGIVGEKGSGKGLFASIAQKLLPNKHIEMFNTNRPIREVISILDKEISRENYTIIATAMRKAFNDNGVWYPAARKLLRSIEADIITVDGIRKKEEVQLIREFNGVLLYITADQRLRYERRKLTSEKADELNISFEAFAKQELTDPEIDIPTIGSTLASTKIENNGTVEEFEEKVRQFLQNQGLL